MKTRISAAALAMVLMLAVNVGHAAMPANLAYQGSLYQTDGTPVDGIKKLTFKMYNAAGTVFWSEVQNVTISKGRYSTVLGAGANKPTPNPNPNPNPLNIGSFTGDTFLGITVESDNEMSPREQLTSVAFAFNGVPQGGIILWSGNPNAVPAGWALCDGNNNTPDLRSRFVVGASAASGPSGLSKYDWTATGTKGGAEAVALTIDQIPSHNHMPDTPAGHAYKFTNYYVAGYNTTTGDFDSSVGEPSLTGPGLDPKTVGGGQAHENRPPYYALAYIMKL